MTRQRLGWGLVCLAAVLLVLQVVPALGVGRQAPRPSAGRVVIGPTLAADPGASLTEFRAHRLSPSREALFVDRAGGGSRLSLVGWGGEDAGSVQVPIAGRPQVAGWPVGQSPSGARFLAGDRLLGIDGGTTSLDAGAGVKFDNFTWRDDSQGACALTGEAGKGTNLLEFIFNPTSTEVQRFPVAAEFAFQGQLAPTVLACSRLQRVVVLGLVTLDRKASLLVLDLVTGKELGRRSYPGPVGNLVVSPDAKLVAVNGDSSFGGHTASTVRNVDSGKAIQTLGAGVDVRAFSADGQAVLVSRALGLKSAILRVGDSTPVWSDESVRRLLGWVARPISHDFALALAPIRPETCTKGEPGKYPEFCLLKPLQDLVVVSGSGGAVTSLGTGVGAWDYSIP